MIAVLTRRQGKIDTLANRVPTDQRAAIDAANSRG